MNAREKFRIAYSKTRQALREANLRRRGQMSIGWISQELTVHADASEHGQRINIATSDPAITAAVVATLQAVYAAP